MDKSEISRKILSDITVYSKYAKYLPDQKRREVWEESADRNMNMHIKKFPTLKDEIIEAYEFVKAKKVLPSMRALEDSTPIRTTFGWKSAGDIVKGDALYSSSGKPTTVKDIVKFQDKDLWTLKFSDGATLTACDEHLWIISTKDDRLAGKTRIVDTKFIRDHLKQGDALNISIANPEPIEGHPTDTMHVDPYILGHWLGDGYSSGYQISCSVEDSVFISNEYEKAGYLCKKSLSTNMWTWGVKGLAKDLRKHDLVNNKHIPEEYQNGTFQQRLALLQGLMDSDGCITPEGRCIFSNTNITLIENVKELISSLGIKHTTTVSKPKEYTNHLPLYEIRFTTNLPVVRLPRKLERIRSDKLKQTEHRKIVDVIYYGKGNATCFHVDSDDHSFLAGREMIVTHNSLQFGGKPVEISPNRLYNCFSRDTKFITELGLKSFADFNDGDKVSVQGHIGRWNRATVRKYGKQKLNKVTLRRGKSEKIVFVTSDHRWIKYDGSETTNLAVGDILYPTQTEKQTTFDYDSADPMHKLYWCYGFVYGDGTITHDHESSYSLVRLCGDDTRYLPRFKEMGFSSSEPNTCNGDIFVYTGKYQKTAPDLSKEPLTMIKAFLDGYLCADGYKNPDWYRNPNLSKYKSIQSSQKDHIEFLMSSLEMCGYYITNISDLTGQETNFGVKPETYSFSITNKIGSRNNTAWSVYSIEDSGRMEDVWCLEVEQDRSFILSGGIVTGNCSYLPCDDVAVFSETMFLLLGGSGVGYSVQKHHVDCLPEVVGPKNRQRRHLIGDSIEGWADAVKVLVESYFFNKSEPVFDFRDIRPKGTLLKTSGGRAPGPQPLKDCLHNIRKVFDSAKESRGVGTKLTTLEVHDIMCLHHDTLIVLSDGSLRKIGEIVKNREEVEVMSFNEDTGLFEPKKVTNWYKNDYPEADWMRLNFEGQRSGKHGPLGGWFTHNHKFLTKDGWKELQDITSNDYVNAGEYALSSITEQMILGSTLGDGSLVKQGTAHFVCSHSEKHKDYVDFKKKILETESIFSSDFSQERQTEISGRKYDSTMCGVRSKSLYSISELYNRCYVDGKKKVTRAWTDKINRVGLAFWYMDDGSYSKKQDRPNGYASFASYNMSLEEVKLLQTMLEHKFDIESVIDELYYEEFDSMHYRIRLNVENSKKLFELINIYIPKSMEYKLPEEYRTPITITFDEVSPKTPLYIRVNRVECMSETNTRRYKTSYCIDVEDNHNFKTLAGIAHNCYIADAVLAGGIRRAALISLFTFDDDSMLTCKYGNWWELNPQRARANNSAVALRHRIREKAFKEFWEKVKASGSGEPGIYFSNDKDYGTNPCAEIALKACGFCNLTTVNVGDVESQDDLNNRVRMAARIGTYQASYTNFHYLRDIWETNCEKEPLLGVSMTGIASGKVLDLNLEEAAKIAVEENERVANLIGMKPAKRVTCIKPEGCQKKETIVSTKQGILSLDEIGDITSEKIWQDHDITIYTDKEERKSTKFYKNGKAKTKKILTDGGIELESTYNHMYRVLTEDGDYVWMRSDELEEGMMLPYSIGEYDGGSIQSLYKISATQTNQKVIKQPSTISNDFAWFLGLYFGDGSNHKKGIRIHGNYNEQKGFDKVKEIVNNLFDLPVKLLRHPANDGRCSLYINSTMLLSYLSANGLLKNKSNNIEIPEIIRRSPKDIIESFIDGYYTANGCDKSETRSFCTTSKKMAEQLVVVLRAIGKDCKMRLMPPTCNSFGNNMRYWIQERKGRLANQSKIRKYMSQAYTNLSERGLHNLSVDTIVSISDGECDTYDIEVNDDSHTYLANSYVSHNTASLVVGSSSGIHAWHNKYYIRRLRVNKEELMYKYLKRAIPDLVEDDVLKPETDSVISIPIKAPDGAITREEGALVLLERGKKFFNEWVAPGHRDGQNKHNVSITVSVRDDEWETVGQWMWDNRKFYNGIAVLPYDGGSYTQAPFEDCDENTYNIMLDKVRNIDLKKIVEDKDTTKQKEELACSGGVCSITHL